MSGTFGVMHRLNVGSFTLTPALDLGAATLRGSEMAEAGAGPQGTVLDASEQGHAWIEPSIGFGFERSLANRKLLRTYARLGAIHYLSAGRTEVVAGLAGAPAGVAPMRIVSDLDRDHVIVEGGFELVASERFTVSASYAAQGSDIRDSGTGAVRFVIPMN
jgi:hypothetical protein